MPDEPTPTLSRSCRPRSASRRSKAVGAIPRAEEFAKAIAGEAGELSAELQWLTTAEANALEPAVKRRVAREAADVLIYLVHLPDVLGVDLVEEAMATARRNEKRFPMDAKEHE